MPAETDQDLMEMLFPMGASLWVAIQAFDQAYINWLYETILPPPWSELWWELDPSRELGFQISLYISLDSDGISCNNFMPWRMP